MYPSVCLSLLYIHRDYYHLAEKGQLRDALVKQGVPDADQIKQVRWSYSSLRYIIWLDRWMDSRQGGLSKRLVPGCAFDDMSCLLSTYLFIYLSMYLPIHPDQSPDVVTKGL